MNLLFIDTETTGLDYENDRVVQLASRLLIGESILDFNSYIKPEGFDIPEQAQRIHGITTEFAREVGISLHEVLDALATIIPFADAIVGHFIQYDVRMIVAEAHRARRPELAEAILAIPHICTKQMSAEYLQQRGEVSTRTATKLGTMFERFTQEPLDDAHDAFTDVLACERIHKELIAA